MFLKQSTASQSVLIGPFLDSTDGDTAETGLTIANTDIRLSKNGGNMAAKNSGGGTHDEAGWYTITLDATDTNTVGTLQLSVDVSGALPVWHEFQVVEESVYDNFFATSAVGPLTAAQVNAQCDTALTDYDPPTNAEMEARTIAAANYATAANLATVDTNVDAILVDTGTTLPATLATIDTVVDAILVDTDTTIPGLIAALNDITVADVLTTQMTQSYASDGTAPTLAQALFAIQQFLQERAVSGTTVTVKQLDGSTTAMTFTLDDGTAPTSITRAT